MSRARRWFRLRPRRWRDWVNPFWWRRARVTEDLVLFYMVENDTDKKLEQMLLDMAVYGSGSIEMNYPKED